MEGTNLTSESFGDRRPIGIFDSGVGGLSLAKAVVDLMPNEQIIYIADSQFSPYGNKTDEVIESRVSTLAAFLIKHQVKAMVVACNTATAAAIELIRSQYEVPIIGVEPALKPAAEYTRNHKIGVIATQSTLASKKYQLLRERFSEQNQIIEKASPYFVELVERSAPISPKEWTLIENELAVFKQAKVDSLVLGCTHYPFLIEPISQIIGPQVKLFESGVPVAKELRRRLDANLNLSKQSGGVEYYSSAPYQSQGLFEAVLGKTVNIRQL